jgi:hypothetical protein
MTLGNDPKWFDLKFLADLERHLGLSERPDRLQAAGLSTYIWTNVALLCEYQEHRARTPDAHAARQKLARIGSAAKTLANLLKDDPALDVVADVEVRRKRKKVAPDHWALLRDHNIRCVGHRIGEKTDGPGCIVSERCFICEANRSWLHAVEEPNRRIKREHFLAQLRALGDSAASLAPHARRFATNRRLLSKERNGRSIQEAEAILWRALFRIWIAVGKKLSKTEGGRLHDFVRFIHRYYGLPEPKYGTFRDAVGRHPKEQLRGDLFLDVILPLRVVPENSGQVVIHGSENTR